MASKSYISGRNFEYSFIKNLEKNGDAVRSGRFYASKGVTDVWWVDCDGKHNEAQLKWSAVRKPYISPDEMKRLKVFACDMNGKILVWLVTKRKGEKIKMERVF